jgi:hypothetical protein
VEKFLSDMVFSGFIVRNMSDCCDSFYNFYVGLLISPQFFLFPIFLFAKRPKKNSLMG